MINYNKNSHKGFYYGIAARLGVIILIVLTQVMIRLKSDTLSILIGLLTFTLGGVGLIGLASKKGATSSKPYPCV